MSTLIDLMNPVGVKQEEKKNTEVYRVSFKDGKNGIYRSVIRFIPFYANPAKCMMYKAVSWVFNPLTQKGLYIDDPRSVGKDSPVSTMYWKMYNTGVATYVDWAKHNLGSKQQYASLVQIMADEQHPELVGQIKVFIYGKKIWEKLNNEEHPQGAGQQGINPFHPIYGRKFSLVCTNQSNFNNFDQSSFFDERNGNQIAPSGMWYIDPSTGQFAITDENTDPNILMDYLSKNSPDLEKYDYHDWTDEQTKHVQEVLAIATNFIQTGSMQSANTQAYQANMQTINTPTIPGQTVTPTYNPAPVFPGATVAPTSGGFVPPTQSAPVMPQVPPTTQQVQPSTTPEIPGVNGVTPPTITPKVATQVPPTTQNNGLNMDDILAQL